mgnify:CR=1 FL=1
MITRGYDNDGSRYGRANVVGLQVVTSDGKCKIMNGEYSNLCLKMFTVKIVLPLFAYIVIVVYVLYAISGKQIRMDIPHTIPVLSLILSLPLIACIVFVLYAKRGKMMIQGSEDINRMVKYGLPLFAYIVLLLEVYMQKLARGDVICHFLHILSIILYAKAGKRYSR